MRRPLRVGLIGYGVMGKNHARILRSLDGVELVGIVDPYLEVQSIDGIRTFSSVSSIISEKIDYAVVAVPTKFHEEVALELLEAEIHCLIEKPIASNLSSAMEIKQLSEKKGVIVGVGHIERFNSALQQARVRIESDQLGALYQISTRRQGPYPHRISDVGVVKDLATHDIDLTRWVASSSYESISAVAAFRSGRDHEDLVVVSGQLASKVVVNHNVNWLNPKKDRSVTIMGEKGVLFVDTLNSELTFFENGNIMISQSQLAHFHGVTQGHTYSYAFDRPEPLLIEHQTFRDAVLGLKNEIVSVEEGIETLRVAESILESIRTGLTQKL